MNPERVTLFKSLVGCGVLTTTFLFFRRLRIWCGEDTTPYQTHEILQLRYAPCRMTQMFLCSVQNDADVFSLRAE